MRQVLAIFMLAGMPLTAGNVALGGEEPEKPKPPPLRANKASTLTQAQVRQRIEPQLEKGMTETELQKALGTLPVLTGNGELLWVLKDGMILTASLEGNEQSKIVCWLIRSDR